MFAAIPSSVQQTILCMLFDLLVDCKDADVAVSVRHILKGLSLDAHQLICEINKLLQVIGKTSGSTVRKAKKAATFQRMTRSAASGVKTDSLESGSYLDFKKILQKCLHLNILQVKWLHYQLQ